MSEGRELNWDDQIQNDRPEFVVLPEGDYDFEVVGFERARHNGSDKLPPCWKAVIHIKIECPEGISIIKHNLFLHSKTETMISDFFVAIGLRKRKQIYRPEWDKVVGSRGRAKIGIREYEGKKFNEIKRFYDPVEKTTSQPAFYPGRF